MDFLKQNFAAIAIGALTLVSTYTIYGYRLDALEKRATITDAALTALTSNAGDTRVALVKIQTDIEYIKLQLSKITP